MAGRSTRTTSSAESIFNRIRKNKTVALVALAALAAAIIGLLYFRRDGVNQPDQSTQAAQPDVAGQQLKITPFRVSGTVGGAAISPDGKVVAYQLVNTAKGESSVFVRNLETKTEVQLFPSSKDNYWGFVFSPDSNYLYYKSNHNGHPPNSFNKVPMLGGTPQTLIADFTSAGDVALSPDGKQIAFIRDYSTAAKTNLVVANEDGTSERTITSREGTMAWLYGTPAWSPDGKTIACFTGTTTGGYHSSLTAVQVADGSEEEFGPTKWRDGSSVKWLPDGKSLIVVAREYSASPGQIWRVSYSDGSARRLTGDLNAYWITSMTADGSTLLAFQSKESTDVWTTPLGAGRDSNPKQVTSTETDGGAVNWTPDGKIVFSSNVGSGRSIWLMNADGSNRTQLTSGADDWRPAVSPDGRHIVFISSRSKQAVLWSVDVDGNNLRQLTSNDDIEDNVPRYTADGKWVVFQSWRTGKVTIWKIPAEGGAAAQLSDKSCMYPEPSPDGKLVACLDRDAPPSHARVLLLPIEGGDDTVRTVDLPPNSGNPVKWTADGRALTFVRYNAGANNIWKMPVEGGEPAQLTSFASDPTTVPGIFYYSLSPDGKQFVVARSAYIDRVFLITDFK